MPHDIMCDRTVGTLPAVMTAEEEAARLETATILQSLKTPAHSLESTTILQNVKSSPQTANKYSDEIEDRSISSDN